MPADKYDVTVIGGGPGGYTAAIRCAQLGLRTAIIEQSETFGGTCLNIGCIPSKALLDSTELYQKARDDFDKHGIKVGELSFDLKTMMKRKESIVGQLTGGVAGLLKQNKVQTVIGRGRLTAPGRVSVSADSSNKEMVLESKQVILASGSLPAELPFLPTDGKHIIGSTEALSLDKVPKSLVVVGGGAIGLELGSVWSRLGSEVTVVELLPQILPGWDSQIARLLTRLLSAQGIKILNGTKISGYTRSKTGVTLQAENGESLSLKADKVLVAVGRRPHTADLGLETMGIELDSAGRVTVDDGFQTSVPGVYAIGDLIRGPMLAHKAGEEGAALAERLAGKAGLVNEATIPGVVYTWPEVAALGATEEQLKEQGRSYSKGIFNFRANGRALAMDSPDGLVKILADQETDRLLGMHIIGPWASDLIAEGVTVMEFGGSSEDIARTVHAHPTLAEVVKEAALDVDGRAIHAPPVRKRA